MREWGTFSRLTIFEVGKGTNDKFWHDFWCGGQVLKEAFMELNRIENFK